MTDVRLPDGTIARFPDGTSTEAMKAAIQKRFPPGSSPTRLTHSNVAPRAFSKEVSSNIEYAGADGKPASRAQFDYDRALTKLRETYYSGMDDAQWSKMVETPAFKPLDAGGLLNSGAMWNLGDEAAGLVGMLGSPSASIIDDISHGRMPEAFTDYQSFDQARRELGREKAGTLGTVAEIGGSVLAAGPGGRIGAPTTAIRTPTVTTSAIDAGKQGALYGFAATEGDLADRAQGALTGATTGATVGAAAPMIANAGGKLLEGFVQHGAEKAAIRSAPSAAAIKRSARSAYKEMENTGAIIGQPALSQLDREMRQVLGATGEGLISPSGRVSSAYPKVSAALADLEEFAAAPLGMKGAQTLHKSLRRVAGSTDPEEARIGMVMLDQFENWMDNLPLSAVSGRADEAFNAWAKGKSEWARFKKVATLETAIGKAGRAKGGFAAGLRSQFSRILDSDKKKRGFTQAELDAMEAFVQGGTIEKLVNAMTGLRGFLSAAGAGVLSGNPAVTLGLMAAGAAAKGGLNRGARTVAERMKAAAATPGGVPRPNLPMPVVPQMDRFARSGGRIAYPLAVEE